MGLGTIFWVQGTKSTSNRWGGGFRPPRPRLSLQAPAFNRVNKRSVLLSCLSLVVIDTDTLTCYSLHNFINLKPVLDGSDGEESGCRGEIMLDVGRLRSWVLPSPTSCRHLSHVARHIHSLHAILQNPHEKNSFCISSFTTHS